MLLKLRVDFFLYTWQNKKLLFCSPGSGLTKQYPPLSSNLENDNDPLSHASCYHGSLCRRRSQHPLSPSHDDLCKCEKGVLSHSQCYVTATIEPETEHPVTLKLFDDGAGNMECYVIFHVLKSCCDAAVSILCLSFKFFQFNYFSHPILWDSQFLTESLIY